MKQRSSTKQKEALGEVTKRSFRKDANCLVREIFKEKTDAPDLNHDPCSVEWSKHGDCVGTVSSRAPQQDRLLRHRWVCGVGTGSMGKCLRHTRTSVTGRRGSQWVSAHPKVLRFAWLWQ